jgi:hypothetical protein
VIPLRLLSSLANHSPNYNSINWHPCYLQSVNNVVTWLWHDNEF